MASEIPSVTCKLLLDQNFSYRLKSKLTGFFGTVEHVSTVNLVDADDLRIWNFARTENFVVITQDADFNDLNILLGWPPKIIWIRCGNKSTTALIEILQKSKSVIRAFVDDKTAGLLEIYK